MAKSRAESEYPSAEDIAISDRLQQDAVYGVTDKTVEILSNIVGRSLDAELVKKALNGTLKGPGKHSLRRAEEEARLKGRKFRN